MKKLTVAAIIPARNEEQDLPNCLDSAVKQTSALDEIIVVNDGSTDRTQEIVEGYMKKHKQIKLI
ncbi:MAG: glycosyltransferase family 2 protein, partial [Candidatus Aenigmarchaeota archaeon]|nr:glycosyltransferase family 2 protein [Candidatus Aenigmarchaeota archaeon]